MAFAQVPHKFPLLGLKPSHFTHISEPFPFKVHGSRAIKTFLNFEPHTTSERNFFSTEHSRPIEDSRFLSLKRRQHPAETHSLTTAGLLKRALKVPTGAI